MIQEIRPCKICGACDRYKSGRCKACAKAAQAERYQKKKEVYQAYRLENRAKTKETNAAWHEKNRDKVRKRKAEAYAADPARFKERSAAWKAANPAKVRAIDIAWRKANPGAVVSHRQNRRARKLRSEGRLSAGLTDRLFEQQKGKCPCCAQPLGDAYHLDHIVPLALGGTNTDDNMQLLRPICNHQKHAKDPIDFMQSRGFLL